MDDDLKIRKHSEDFSLKDNISIKACKNYTRLANQTLTSFTDEMSELLQQSIKRLDNISLQVREYMYDIQNQSKLYQMRSNQPEYKDPDEWEITVVKCKSTKNVPKAGKSKSMIEIKRPSGGESKDPKPPEPKKRRHVVSMYNKCIREAKRIFSTSAKRKSIEMYYDSLTERHVRNSIREQHRLLKKWMRSSSQDFPEAVSERRKKRKHGKLYRLRRNLWPGLKRDEKAVEVLPLRKEARLARKSACENLRKAPKDEVKLCEEFINLVTPHKSKEELTILVHTQKPSSPNHDLKCNSSCLPSADILDEVTLRDLEPIKSEYPRKDHLSKTDEPVQDSLLYKLVNEHTDSLEYLVSIDDGLKTNERRRRYAARRSVFTIPEEEPPTVQPKHRRKKGNRQGTRQRTRGKAQSSGDCKRDVKKHLKNAISELESKPVTDYIVMPVTVHYDSDVSMYQRKRRVEDILRPYIYLDDKILHRQEVMVMTLTVEEPKPSFKNRSPTEVSSPDGGPILVQRFVTCNQGSEVQNGEPREQMISFVVNEDKKHLLASDWVMDAEESPAQRTRRRLPKSQEIKNVIEKMENRLKEASKQPRKNQLKVIETEMQNILSKMQFDPEDIDFSSTSTSTSNSFMKLTKKSNLNVASKKLSLPSRLTPRKLSFDSSTDTLTSNPRKTNENSKELKSYKKITGYNEERSKADKAKARTFLSETKVPTVDVSRTNKKKFSEEPRSLARLEKYLTEKVLSVVTEKKKAGESDGRCRKKTYFEKGSLPGEQPDTKTEVADPKEMNESLRLTEELGKETRKLCSEIDDVIKQMQEQQEHQTHNCESSTVPPPQLSESYNYETFKKRYFNAERLSTTQSLWRLAQIKHLSAEQYLVKHVERYSVESLGDDPTKGTHAKSVQVRREEVYVDKTVQVPLTAQRIVSDNTHGKLLTFVYGLIFAVVFGGLNYKYFCA